MRRIRLPALGAAITISVLVGGLLAGTLSAQEALTITLNEQNDSGQSGAATLTPMGDQLMVSVQTTGAPAGPQPAHIHSGTCEDLGGVVYPLTNVMNGQSETAVNASLADVTSSPHAINIHLSPDQADVYTACGNLPVQVTAAAASEPAQAPASLPRTGGLVLPLAGLTLAGLLSLGLGVLNRRRVG